MRLVMLLAIAQLPACKQGPSARPAADAGAPAMHATDARLDADRAITAIDAAPDAIRESSYGDIDPLLADAFGRHPPALPLLAKDGSAAAVDLSRGLGMSSVSTYEVGIMKPAGGVVRHVTVIDAQLASAILKAAASQRVPSIPRAKLAKAAAAIEQQLETFTPFTTEIDFDAIQRAHGELALGPTKLAVDDASGLRLEWRDAAGAIRRQQTIPSRPRQFTNREGGRCGGTPRLAGVWWDAPRDHVLMQVIFPGHDSCEDEPALWIFW